MGDLKFPITYSGLTEKIEESHSLVLATPTDDPSLAFKLMLPKTWMTEEDQGEQQGGVGHLVKIGVFAEKLAPDTAIVQVSFSRIPFELNVLDWVRYEAANNMVKLTYSQHIKLYDGPAVDAGGYTGPPENRHVIRIVAFASSARIFMVMGMVQEQRYEELMDTIAIATHSFRLSAPSGNALEQQLQITVSDPDFIVAYPNSWEPVPVADEHIEGKSGLDLRLVNDGEMLGYLRVKGIDQNIHATTTAQQLLSTAVEEIAETGMQITSQWQDDNDQSVTQISNLVGTYVAEASSQTASAQVRVGIVERDGLTFVATLISVPFTGNKVLWMRSKRAYEIALESVHIV